MYRIATCALVGTGTSAFQQLSLASNGDQATVFTSTNRTPAAAVNRAPLHSELGRWQN